MGKKKQQSSMGRAIIKDRFGKTSRATGDSFVSLTVFKLTLI